jgi:hypothetical protein
MIGNGSGVANMRSVRWWLAVLALAGAVAAPAAAPAQTPVPMEFPPPGTRWITRSVDQTGGSYLITYTVLDPGSFQGRPGFRVADNVGVQFFVLVRQEATEARTKSLIGGARLLHFATHGELNERDPLASGLLRSPGGGGDGRLEVREIFGLDLKAQLVVLSACETGLGQLSTGDELVGLQRAFLYAGSPAVVTTLWKVDDRASFTLMREFYDQLAKLDAAQALQAAQRAAMKEFPHPFAWAAFGLTGVGH